MVIITNCCNFLCIYLQSLHQPIHQLNDDGNNPHLSTTMLFECLIFNDNMHIVCRTAIYFSYLSFKNDNFSCSPKSVVFCFEEWSGQSQSFEHGHSSAFVSESRIIDVWCECDASVIMQNHADILIRNTST